MTTSLRTALAAIAATHLGPASQGRLPGFAPAGPGLIPATRQLLAMAPYGAGLGPRVAGESVPPRLRSRCASLRLVSGKVFGELAGELPPCKGEPVAVDERIDGFPPAADDHLGPGRVCGTGQSGHGDKQGPEILWHFASSSCGRNGRGDRERSCTPHCTGAWPAAALGGLQDSQYARRMRGRVVPMRHPNATA